MNNIKRIRENQNISQATLANQLGISQPTLSTWETEKYEPDLKSLIKLSQILHTTIDHILGETSENIILITKSEFETLKKAKNIIIEIEKNNPQIKNKVKIVDNHGKIYFK